MLPAIRTNGALIPSTAPVNRLATLFDRFFNDDWATPMAPPAWRPAPMSLWEDEQNVHVEMDTPGLTDKDLELFVHQGVLVIRGERRRERQPDGYDTRAYGRFEQRVTLPTSVDADQVEARLAHGVLRVTLPKSEHARPRRITLKAE